MTTPAGVLQEHLKKRVEGTGGQYRKVKWEGRNGAPDTLVWWQNPRFAFIEVKAGDDELSKLQEREIERMQGAGFCVFVARTKEDIDEIVLALTHPVGRIQ